jgi:hypothetical protein
MGKKLDKIYEALLDGAADGLSGKALYKYVSDKCPKTSSKRIVKASLLALSDPHVKDRQVLNVIYALAIDYRLQNLGAEDHDDEDEDAPAQPTLTEETKKRLQQSTAPAPMSPLLPDGSAVH